MSRKKRSAELFDDDNEDFVSGNLRWNKRSEDGKMLIRMMKMGEIQPHDKPSDVVKRCSRFQKYNPTSFRSAFHRASIECGLNV